MKAGSQPVQNTVQSYGCLMAADVHSGIISHVSVNCADFLGVVAPSLYDQTLADVLSDTVAHDVNNVLCHSTSRFQRAAAGSMNAAAGTLDMSVHMRANVAIVELQPRGDSALDGTEALERLRWLFTKVDRLMSAEQFVQEATNLLRVVSGHHRVLAYCFEQGGASKLIAESCESLTDPFTGTGYPRHEGTPPFERQWPDGAVRHIADTGADDVQVQELGGEQDPLDMSLAMLRGVKPDYRAQLQAGGVLSCMSLPIVVRGRLWGVFVAHHRRVRVLSRDQLMAVEASGKLLSLLIGHQLGR